MTRSQESPRTSPAEQPRGAIRDTLDTLRQDAQAALDRAERRLAVVDAVAKVTADLKARGVHGKLDITASQIVLTVDLDKPDPTGGAPDTPERPAKPLGPSPFASGGTVAPKPTLVGERPEECPRPAKPVAQVAEPVETHKAPEPSKPQPTAEFKTGAWSKREGEDAMRWSREGLTNNEIAAKLGRDPRGVAPKLAHMARKLKERDAEASTPVPDHRPGETFTPPPPVEADAQSGRANPKAITAPRPVVWGDEEFPSAHALAAKKGSSVGALRNCIERGYNFCGRPVRWADAAPAEDAAKPSPAPQPVETDTSFNIDLSKATSGSDRLVRVHLRALGHVAPWTPERDLKLVQGLASGDGLGATAEALGIDKAECRLRWAELLPEVTINGQAQLLATLKAVVKEAAQ